MNQVSILFVDDEEDIRFSFEDYFEEYFSIYLASNGKEALTVLEKEKQIGVVVTDIRMPEMNGLELIKIARDINPDLGFIVVSGHGDADDIIHAMRLGARNYLRKPYNFNELKETIEMEAHRFQILKEEDIEQEKEKIVGQFLTSINEMAYLLPSRMELVTPLSFKLVRNIEALGKVDDGQRGNVVLALIEIINNSIEHGNLGITGDEKIKLKLRGEKEYFNEIERRKTIEPYKDRMVKINFSLDEEKATFRIEDEGDGFNYNSLPDPTDSENIFLPSGRGLLMARTFLDEVNFEGKGNIVTLIKYHKRKLN